MSSSTPFSTAESGSGEGEVELADVSHQQEPISMFKQALRYAILNAPIVCGKNTQQGPKIIDVDYENLIRKDRELDEMKQRTDGDWETPPDPSLAPFSQQWEKDKIVKMVQLTWDDSVARKPEYTPDEDDLVCKVNSKLMDIEEATVLDAEQIAKDLDLRPGVKVLSNIPMHRFGFYSYLDEKEEELVPMKLTLAYMDVQELGVLQAFPFLQALDLTGNKLRMDNMGFLEHLQNLRSLVVDDNRLYACDLPCPKLEHFSIRQNRLIWVDPFTYPAIKYLYLDDNRMKMLHNLDDEYCPNLIKLSAGGNRMRSTLAQWSCSIQFLFLIKCKIRKVEGLENLVNLHTLHLRGNRIKKLHGFTWHLQSLSYLNLRDNKISNLRQFKRLRPLRKLRTLIVTGCPFEENKTEEKARWSILYAYKNLKRINKKWVTQQELDNRDLGKDDIDNDEDSSDDAIPEDSEEEEEGPPIEWDDDDDPDSEHFDPKRTHVQEKKFTRRSKHPLLDHYTKECKDVLTGGKKEEPEPEMAEMLSEGEGESEAQSEAGTPSTAPSSANPPK